MGIFRLPAPSAELGVLYPLFAIAFMVEVGLGIVSPILPAIMHEFSLSASQIALMVTLFGLARLLTDLLPGFILDQADRTKVLVMGTLLIVVGSTGCAIAPNYSLVLFARAVMGAGSAVCLVTLLVIISKASHEGAKGSAIGVFQASLLAGVAMGPAVGGVSASLAGWRTAFIVCAVAAGLTTLLVLVAARRGTLKLPTAPRLQDGRRETNVSERHERHNEGPRWDLTAINFTTFVFFVSVSGFRNSMIPVYGGTEIGLSIAALGLMLAGSGVIRFFVTLQSGFASDRYGRKIILVPGIGFLVAGTLGFVLARDRSVSPSRC